KYVHGSCVYGLKDLADLMKQPHLVAHKMYIDFQPAAFFCALKKVMYLYPGRNGYNLISSTGSSVFSLFPMFLKKYLASDLLTKMGIDA
ncbi:hypothetical protein NECAME_05165, partial [Necator americanus]